MADKGKDKRKEDAGPRWANPMTYSLAKKNARRMRMTPTPAELLLWKYLRASQIHAHFRRQYIIDEYVADFVALKHNLIIEIDGKYHDTPHQQTQDDFRTQALENLGFNVLRFTNEEIFSNIDHVIDVIYTHLAPCTQL